MKLFGFHRDKWSNYFKPLNKMLHIRDIFKEGELQENSVVKVYLTTANDGKSINNFKTLM